MIRKYLGLLYSFFRASLMSDLEYRLNIILKFGNDILWYAAQLSVFEALFSYTKSLSGWSLEETRFFMAMLFIADSIFMILFSENLDKLSDRVRKGEIDMLLTKPANSQFILSFQKMNTAYCLNLVLTSSWLMYSLAHLPGGVTAERILTLLVVVPCGVSLIYATRFIFSASALIFTKADNINYLWFNLYKLGTRPAAVYPTWLRYILMTAVPTAFFASVPAQLVMGGGDIWLLLWAIGLSVIFTWITIWFWRYALTFYSSASS